MKCSLVPPKEPKPKSSKGKAAESVIDSDDEPPAKAPKASRVSKPSASSSIRSMPRPKVVGSFFCPSSTLLTPSFHQVIPAAPVLQQTASGSAGPPTPIVVPQATPPPSSTSSFSFSLAPSSDSFEFRRLLLQYRTSQEHLRREREAHEAERQAHRESLELYEAQLTLLTRELEEARRGGR